MLLTDLRIRNEANGMRVSQMYIVVSCGIAHLSQ